MLLLRLMLFLLFFPGPVFPLYSAELKPEFLAALSATMQGIYDRIAEEKENREVLRDLDPSAIKRDENGWPYFEYADIFSDQAQFAVRVRAFPVDAVDEERGVPGYKEFLYPTAGIKLGAYVKARAGLGALNVMDVVRIQGRHIEAAEQEILPIRLYFENLPSTIRPGQMLVFGLQLKNVSSMKQKLKKLNEDSAYCSFNGQLWGNKKAAGNGGGEILLPGNSLRMKLSLRPDRRGDFEIFCSYGIGANGLRPSARAMVRVE